MGLMVITAHMAIMIEALGSGLDSMRAQELGSMLAQDMNMPMVLITSLMKMEIEY